MKAFFNVTPTTFVNHYIVNVFVGTTTLGVATFPWADEAMTAKGGVINRADSAWGAPSAEYTGVTAVHELGHALGLWHTHTGVSEVTGCSDPCLEELPLENTAMSSNVTGDLCGDTRPTPVNYQCQDPAETDCSSPSPRMFVNTPFRNPMGYADDACMDGGPGFSRDQKGRMRCYIDCFYSSWKQPALRNNAIPPTIVRAPIAINSGLGPRVTWFAPLGPAENSAFTLERSPAFTSAVTAPAGTLEYQDNSATPASTVR
eukprot:TRINITY_DN3966_c0_g1_i1.p1 TRINITY_DN3966_c0_g1~~TRINITY_DN3966_c0_g1_i1.p1  ORF type:complete len:259 (-),score=27.25 TRINITY_DN3966_c0_g1_i1:152-928(-)